MPLPSFIVIVAGITLVILGVYYLKYDPESWSWNPRTWIEQSDWSACIYTGAFLIVGGVIMYWFGI